MFNHDLCMRIQKNVILHLVCLLTFMKPDCRRRILGEENTNYISKCMSWSRYALKNMDERLVCVSMKEEISKIEHLRGSAESSLDGISR
jgi:hypothetical protein